MTEASVSFTLASSACGPGNRETDYACAQPSSIVLTTAFWVVSVVVWFGCLKWFFRRLGVTEVRLRRNVVAYIINLIVSTPAIIIQFAYASPLLFHGEEIDTTAQRLTWFSAFNIVCLMTLWELIYRIDINPSLLAHHICTIALCLLFSISLYDIESNLLENTKLTMMAYTRNDTNEGNAIRTLNEHRHVAWITGFRLGLITILSALTEQPSFVALLMHRANHRHSRAAFYTAAIWSGVSKTTFWLWGMTVYIYKRADHEGCEEMPWCQTMTVLYPILYSLLFATQLWATYILFVLSKRNASKSASTTEKATEQPTTEKPTEQPTTEQNSKTLIDSIQVFEC